MAVQMERTLDGAVVVACDCGAVRTFASAYDLAELMLRLHARVCADVPAPEDWASHD